MSTPAEQLQLLNDERASIRPAILAMQTSMHRALFLLVSVGAITLGLYWKPDTVPETARPTVLLLLTQIELFLSLFVIGLIAHQNVAIGYIAALETTMNKLANAKVTFFESHVAPYFYQSLKGTFGWAKVLIFLFLIGLFFAIGRQITTSRAMAIGLGAEAVALVVLLIATLKEPGRVKAYALKLFET